MPSAGLVRVACFAVGAVLGGGVATALGAHRKKEAVVVSANPPAPIVEVGPKGQTHVSVAPTTVVPAQTHLPKFSNPAPLNDVLERKAYVAAYDRRLRHPAWTAEHLTLSSLGRSALQAAASDDEKGDRGKAVFTEDESIPLPFRAKLQDYFRSGYDRGHMVPAADAKSSQAAMDETFLLTNIAPQVGAGFNRNYWAYLEDWCRRLTGSFSDVYVFTVPLYLPHKDPDGKWRVTYEVIGNPPNIAVPTHFAKVVLATRPSSPSTPDVPEISTGAFVLPNAAIPDETPLENFVVPIETVERASGFTLISDAIKVKAKHICKTAKCEVIVRRFDDAQKKTKAITGPR